MKDIKFRAFQDNKMYIQKNSGIYGTKRFLDTLYEDCELMQYTGLKDRNGTEIYEGDICIYDGFVYPIKFVKNTGAFGFVFMDLYSETDYYDMSVGDVSEIIGNIHENPELLEGEK